MSTQAKFLAAVEAEAGVHGLVVIDDRSYSNVGTVRIEEPGSFVPVLKFGYQFDAGSGSARFSGDLAAEWLGSPSCYVGCRQVRYDELDKAVELLQSRLQDGEGP